MTVPQICAVFRHLLQPTPPSCAKIAHAVSRVLRRTTEARIYHYYAATKTFPPLRGEEFW